MSEMPPANPSRNLQYRVHIKYTLQGRTDSIKTPADQTIIIFKGKSHKFRLHIWRALQYLTFLPEVID